VKPGEISKKDFLDLLKSSSKGPKAESGNDTGASRWQPRREYVSFRQVACAYLGGVLRVFGAVGAALGGGASGGGWAGVKDDLLVKTPKMNVSNT
jgi:hypothetical protein